MSLSFFQDNYFLYTVPFFNSYCIWKKIYIIFIFVLNVDVDFVGDAGDEWPKINDVSALKLLGGVVPMHF